MSKVFDTSKKHFDDLNKISSDNEKENVNIIEQDKLSLMSKIIFAVAGAPYQMFFSALSVFSTVFLLEVANLPPSKTSYINFDLSIF